MNDQLKESISALADGEVDDLELRRLLKLMAEQPEAASALKDEWSRYHLIGAALRGQSHSNCPPGFLADVSAALESGHSTMGEATVITAAANSGTASQGGGLAVGAAAEATSGNAWSRFAIAASVAFVAIIGVQQYQGGDTNEVLLTQQGAVESQQAVNPVGEAQLVSAGDNSQAASVVETAKQLETAEAQKRLNEYLLQHASHAAQQGGQGGVTFARLASFEEEQ